MSDEAKRMTALECSDCRVVHGQFYSCFSEWSWHAPDLPCPIGHMDSTDAARMAWDYQQRRIDAQAATLARYQQMDAEIRKAAGWKRNGEELGVLVLQLIRNNAAALNRIDYYAECEEPNPEACPEKDLHENFREIARLLDSA